MNGNASTGSRAIVAVLASLSLAPVALAGGEPKNEPPFTARPDPPANVRAGLGESKNELPFTRPAVRN
jgi:hypothetical protein